MSMGAAGYGQIIQAIGGAAQAYAAWRTQWDVYHALESELNRQGRFSNQAFDIFSHGLQNQSAESAQRELDTGALEREGMYQGAYNTPLSVGGPHSPQGGVDKANYDLLASRRAKLGAYGDWATRQDVGNLHTAQDLEDIYQRSAGSSRVYPYRLNKAQHEWDQLAGFGQMLSGTSNFAQMFNGGSQPTPSGNYQAAGIRGGTDPNYADYFYQDPSWQAQYYDYQVPQMIDGGGNIVELPTYG